jgi:predicted permease
MKHRLESLLQDIRYALRALGRSPSFTAVVVLTLGLGIGANTAIFSLIDAVLLKMLPVRDPEQLVLLRRDNNGEVANSFSYYTYKQILEKNQVFSDALAYYPLRMNVSINNSVEPAVSGQLVSGNYFSVLGVSAVLGRTIISSDDRAPGESPVCVISNNYWRQRFAADPAVLGKTIHLSGSSFTIIGVTPPEFFGLEVGGSMDISVPLMMQQQVMPGIGSFIDGSNFKNNFTVMGRLRSDFTMEQARANMEVLYRQIVDERIARFSGRAKDTTIQSWRGEKLMLELGSQGLSELRWKFSRPLLTLMTIVALTLAVACANVAGLLLARAVARRKEIAIRLALGVDRLRLIRQLLTESILLGGFGGLCGLFLAYGGSRLLMPLFSQGEIPAHLNLSPDLRVLAFTAAVAALTGAIFGLAPILMATRVDMNTALKNELPSVASGTGTRNASLTFGKIFVVSQVAISLLLLSGAGLFVQSLRNLQHVEAGFARENVLTLKLEPVGSANKTQKLAASYEDLLRRVEGIPGIKQASLVGYSPMSRREWLVMGQNPDTSSRIVIQGRTASLGEEMDIPYMQVFPNSFAALGVSFVAGRDFNSQDNRQWTPRRVCPASERAPQVGIINESMARRFFGTESPIGRRFGFANPSGICFVGGPEPDPATQIEIIGVVKDVKYSSLRNEGRAMFYLPFYQATATDGQMTLIVRTIGNPKAIAAAVSRESRTLDPAMPTFEVETLASQVEASLLEERFIATLSGGFGLLALLLSCLGLYGILSYTVARRTNEIGVRMALGATRQSILWFILRDALRLVVIGVLIGIPAALAAARMVTSQLYHISAADPTSLGAAMLALLVVAILAGYVPARKASLVDPLASLRCE